MRSVIRAGGFSCVRLLAAVGIVTALADPSYAVVACNGEADIGKAAILARQLVPPGFPEGLAIRNNRFYVAGPATFGTTLKGPSKTLRFNRTTGALNRTYDAQGENLLAEHANSCVAFDGDGFLYVLNTQLGMLRLDPNTGTQTVYGKPFPDLHPCLPIPLPPPLGPDCSPTVIDAPALPNDVAFDAAGNAYVTDSMQATIWRVPPGGGDPEIYFQDMRLASLYIGVNGIRVHPDGDRLFLTVTTDLFGGSYVYTLPLGSAPTAADLAVFHKFAPGEGADGIAFGENEDLYVTLALPLQSGIVVYDPSGAEIRRFTNPQLSPIFPYDSPANLAFDGSGRILVTNHAFATGVVLPSQFTVIEVCVGDAGAPLFEPHL